ncbi:MAG TPA: hypothetical protein VNK67_14525, partial [Burkholderiales bacterium]|nr:hypothetical protein [Burkholderiales bacterium]
MRAVERSGDSRSRGAAGAATPSPAPRPPRPRVTWRGALGLAVALLAAGCAELRWERPGTAAAALEQDLAQCRQLARLRAEREAWPAGLDGPRVIGMDRQGRLLVSEPLARPGE